MPNLCFIDWFCSWAATRNTLPNRLAGDTCYQAPSDSGSFACKCRLAEQPSPPGTTLSSSHYECSYRLAV